MDGRRKSQLANKKSQKKYISLFDAFLLLKALLNIIKRRGAFLLNVSREKVFFYEIEASKNAYYFGGYSQKEKQLVPYWHQSVSAFKFNWILSDCSSCALFSPVLFLYENLLLLPIPQKRGEMHQTRLKEQLFKPICALNLFK